MHNAAPNCKQLSKKVKKQQQKYKQENINNYKYS